MKFACQENLLPGSTVLEKWQYAQSIGFAALELQGHDEGSLLRHAQEWRAAQQSGMVVSSLCLAGGPFIGDFDALKRREAVRRLKLLLEVASDLGARGVVTPAAWGIFSRRLPPFVPPRSEQEDRAVLLEGLSEVGNHALSLGVKVFFEPLNRYEDHMVNTLAQGSAYCAELNLESLGLTADLYHMNIEEPNIAASIHAARPYLAHVHLADSNRLEPGAGHTNFAGAFKALHDIGFDGFMAFECRLSSEARESLPKALQYLQSLMP